MNNADDGQFSNPPAGDRVFVRVDGEFTTESWCDAVRAGRTFVTNGPMLALERWRRARSAMSVRHDAGDVLRVAGERRVVRADGALELIVNGEIVASATRPTTGGELALAHDFAVDASCWVALRALGPGAPARARTRDVFAHTSPVYVTVGGAPVRCARRRGVLRRVDRPADRHGGAADRYAKDADREAVVALFREGQEYYRRIAGRVSPPGPLLRTSGEGERRVSRAWCPMLRTPWSETSPLCPLPETSGGITCNERRAGGSASAVTRCARSALAGS